MYEAYRTPTDRRYYTHKQYANAKGIIIDEVFEDIGFGLNYNRKKWNKLIEDCMLGLVKTIIIAHKDRFIRFGYEENSVVYRENTKT